MIVCMYDCKIMYMRILIFFVLYINIKYNIAIDVVPKNLVEVFRRTMAVGKGNLMLVIVLGDIGRAVGGPM